MENRGHWPEFSPLGPQQFRFACLLICVLGLALRLPGLGSRSLWLDESYSVWFASLPLRELWTRVPRYETHPPLYYTLLKGWSGLFGASELAVRSMSVLASVATILLLAGAGRRLKAGPAGERAGLIAALFLAVNRGNIVFSGQARPYALETLTAALAILYALLLLRHFIPAGRDTPGLRRLMPAIAGLGCATGLTLWLHNTAIFIAFGLWAGMFLSMLLYLPGNRRLQLLAIALPGLLAFLIWLPFLPFFLWQGRAVSSMPFWVQFQRSDLIAAWLLAAGGRLPVMPVCLLGLTGWHGLWRHERAMALLLMTVLLLPLCTVLALSYAVKPVFIDRLFAWMAPPLLALAAAGCVAGIRTVRLRTVVVCIIVSLCLLSTLDFYRSPSEDWRATVATIRRLARPHDLVIAIPNEINVPVRYYTRGAPGFPEVLYLPAPFPAAGLQRRYVGNLGAPEILAADTDAVRAALQTHARVWLIERAVGLYDPAGLIRRTVLALRTPAGTYGSHGITVDLFE